MLMEIGITTKTETFISEPREISLPDRVIEDAVRLTQEMGNALAN
jgi:hypothetical protein